VEDEADRSREEEEVREAQRRRLEAGEQVSCWG
jgi:hypothetical protein